LSGRRFPLTWKLPCGRPEAVRVLGEVEAWLESRARMHALFTAAMAVATLLAGAALGGAYAELALLVTAAFAALGVWGYRGNMGLARRVSSARGLVDQGLLDPGDYCGSSILAFIAALEASGRLRV